MNRHDRRRRRALGAHNSRVCPGLERKPTLRYRFATSSPRVLLMGTALASTFLVATLVAPAPARAQVTMNCGADSGVPIQIIPPVGSINCINTLPRIGDPSPTDTAIRLETDENGEPVVLDTSGRLQSYSSTQDAYGIAIETDGQNSTVTITNRGDIDEVRAVGDGDDATGIFAETNNDYSTISVKNSGDIVATSGKEGESYASGIYVQTFDDYSRITIQNSGRITATSPSAKGDAEGIYAYTESSDSSVKVTNSGDIISIGGNYADAIDVETEGDRSRIDITNSGDLKVIAGQDDTSGIEAYSNGDYSPVTVKNYGDIHATGPEDVYGIYAYADGSYSRVTVINTGKITVSNAGQIKSPGAYGIYAYGDDDHSPVKVTNSGNIHATSANGNAYGIYAGSNGTGGNIEVTNSGDITAISGGQDDDASGIGASADEDNSRVKIVNSGRILAQGVNDAYGIWGQTDSDNSRISIINNGSVTARVTQNSDTGDAVGLWANAEDDNSRITITNTGDVRAESTKSGPVFTVGIYAEMEGVSSSTHIINSGSVYAKGSNSTGIYSNSYYANKTTITNTGTIGASSHLAIDVNGAGTADIWNAGLITGFVDLTEQNDRFFNQSGGVFETKKTSFFRGGNDLFVNERGGTVLAATDRTMSETSAFQGLETFRNRGLISMIDGQAGDRFTISNTPGGTDLNFVGGGQLGLDVFLDGATSPADKFFIEGNVSGATTVVVNNTNLGPGTFNSGGIPVIFVDGNTPSESNFQLVEPIDTGLFDYDLFFVPTNSGFWELRSFPGGSAQALPKLLTAAQDLWHQTSATWFDRTADLRVVLNGGSAPGGAPTYDGSSNGLTPGGLTPGVWMKGGGSRLDRDGSATTSAYGRTYNYDLDNEFSSFDLQVGVDMGQYDVLS
ncbi:MAG: hypothetical protein QNJ62_07400, partial [Methyloceanibacter sp.]|nr:hypothetical protein [Methyloceanibacter sp.]